MTETFRCGDNAALVAYLYDDYEPGERETITAHLSTCATCTAELASLGATRRQLAGWSAPDTALGFRITQAQVAGPRLQDSGALKVAAPEPASSAETAPASWWRQPLPAWAQMAAAMVIFAAGLAAGMSSSGQPGPAAPQVASQSPATTAAVKANTIANLAPVASEPVVSVSPTALTELENRLRAEMKDLRVSAPASARSDESVLRRVQVLIDQSEERQRRELALRTAEVVRDFDAQRNLDLVKFQRTMGQLETMTGAQVRDQRQIANWLRVSQQAR